MKRKANQNRNAKNAFARLVNATLTAIAAVQIANANTNMRMHLANQATMTMAAMGAGVATGVLAVVRIFKILFVFHTLFLNSCIAMSQDQLTFIDYTDAADRPDFEFRDMRNGQMYDSRDFDDSAFVLEFYFNGCPACNQNADNVKWLQQQYAGNVKVQIVEVSIDCQNWQYEQWIEKHSPIGPVLNGCNADLVDDLGVRSFPTTYVFSPNKRQAMKGVGVWSRSTKDRLKNFLDQVK